MGAVSEAHVACNCVQDTVAKRWFAVRLEATVQCRAIVNQKIALNRRKRGVTELLADDEQ